MAPSKHTASLFSIVRIAFNFTKSDFKTVVIPSIVYGFLASPKSSFTSLFHCLLWIWLYLLQFCAANQIFSSEEDLLNKPYRPIPSNLISVRSTWLLRWTLVPICSALSWSLGVMLPGASLTFAFIIYNEMGFHSYFYSKNILNAVGIVSWNVGATRIISQGSGDITPYAWIAPYLSTILVCSTIHIQDFRDEAGDRMQGRMTLPVLIPEWSRRLTSIILIAWSLGLAIVWDVDYIMAISFVFLGSYIAFRLLIQRSEEEDKASLRLYMIWLCAAQIIPFQSR